MEWHEEWTSKLYIIILAYIKMKILEMSQWANALRAAIFHLLELCHWTSLDPHMQTRDRIPLPILLVEGASQSRSRLWCVTIWLYSLHSSESYLPHPETVTPNAAIGGYSITLEQEPGLGYFKAAVVLGLLMGMLRLTWLTTGMTGEEGRTGVSSVSHLW